MNTSRVQICEIWINDIPALCCSNGKDERKRLVVLYHAYLDTKEFMLNFAYKLAEIGFLAVAVDLDRHGERANYNKKFPWQEFYNTIFRTAQEINTIIDYFVANGNAQNGNVTVLGTSLGGLTAFAAAIRDERVCNIATILASANFPQLARVGQTSTLKRFFSDNICNKDDYIENVEKMSVIYDPYYNISSLPPKRIFMINGTVDMAIPFLIVEDFQQKLKLAYKDISDKLEFISVPGAGHFLSRDMYDKVLNWMKGLPE